MKKYIQDKISILFILLTVFMMFSSIIHVSFVVGNNAGKLYVYTDKQAVNTSETPTFTVAYVTNSIWTPTIVTIKDLTTQQQKSYSISGSPTQISDFNLGTTLGDHNLEFITSDGAISYLTLTVINTPTGTDTWIYSKVTNTPSVPYINSSFIMNISLDDTNPYFVMNGNEYLYVSAIDMSGSPIIGYYKFSHIAISFPTTITLTLQNPFWQTSGSHTLKIGFTGNQYLTPSSMLYSINYNSDDTQATLKLNSTTIDRSTLTTQPKLEVDTSLSGKIFTSYSTLYYDMILNTLNGNYNLVSLTKIPALHFTTDVSVNIQAPLGNANIVIEIRDASNTVLFSNYTTVLVTDRIKVDVTTNTTTIHAGDTIQFQAFTSIAGRPNQALECSIVVNASNNQIASGNTSNGIFSFIYKIPQYYSANSYSLYWVLTPQFNLTLIPILHYTYNFIVSQPSTIFISNLPSKVLRGSSLSFNAQVLSANIPVIGNAGNFTITNLNTLYRIGSYFANQSATITIPITKNFSIGTLDMEAKYVGTDIYNPVTIDFSTTVFSQPVLYNVTTNATAVIPGDILQVSGFLLQENLAKTPVVTQNIQLYLVGDGISKVLLGNSTTSPTGSFVFTFQATEGLSVGTYYIELDYNGDPSQYYTAIPPYKISFDYNNQLSLAVPAILYANVPFYAHISGAIFGSYQLQYVYPSNASAWVFLANITTDGNGVALSTITTPSQRGPITFRLVSLTNLTNYALANSLVKIVPVASITVLNAPITTNKQNNFLVYCSEPYIVFFNDLQITPASQMWKYNHTIQYSFLKPGNYSLRITMLGNYLNFTSFTYNFTVYEDYYILTTIPSTVTEDARVTAQISVYGYTLGPLQGVDIQILNNKTQLVLSEGITSYGGSITLNVTIIGNANELTIFIPNQKIGQYYILQKSYTFVQYVKRQVEFALSTSYTFSSSTTNYFSCYVKYVNNQSAQNVPVHLLLYQNDTLIWSTTITTSSSGILQVKLPDLSVGSYILFIQVNSSTYSPVKLSTFITIQNSSSSDTTTNYLIVGGIMALFGGVAGVFRLRR